MPAKTIPELTETQHEALRLYRRLELELGKPPSFAEFGAARGGYSKGSERAGAQKILEKLASMGLIEMPRVVTVGGGTTKLGLRVLKREGGQD